jgi:hypothetical protein
VPPRTISLDEDSIDPGLRRMAARRLDQLVGLRGAPILDGIRGRSRADLDALLDVLVAVSHLGMDAGGAIRELDINPLIVLEEGRGALAVDALVVLDIERRP